MLVYLRPDVYVETAHVTRVEWKSDNSTLVHFVDGSSVLVGKPLHEVVDMLRGQQALCADTCPECGRECGFPWPCGDHPGASRS